VKSDFGTNPLKKSMGGESAGEETQGSMEDNFVLVKPNMIEIFRIKDGEFESAVAYPIYAKIVICTKVPALDTTGAPKDLLLFVTSNAEIVLIEFGF
jgi:hypothetical protein